MSTESDQIFEFGPFVLDPLAQTLVTEGEEIPLAPKAFAVLLILVRNAGRTVKKDEIFQEVWPEVIVEDQNVSLNIYLVRKALGDDVENPKYIATLARRGYRFITPVNKRDRVAALPVTEEIPLAAERKIPALTTGTTSDETNSSKTEAFCQRTVSLGWFRSTLAEDRWFLLTSCTLYALLYAIALFVEVAYQFDSYAASAVRVAPFVFLWVWATSMAGLIACRVLTLSGRAYSLMLPISLFVASGVILYLSMGSFLPNVPITKALFHTYPAHGAYLKSISHFFPLAVLFLLMPYHFVIAARTQIRSGSASEIRKLLTGEGFGTAPEGTVFLRLRWLGIMLTVAAIVSIAATAHLMDNLIPTKYTSMFTQLIQWRLVLYFSLGSLCLLWYSRSLNAIKIASLKMDCST
ncbi:MAG TPA: transcriptional regulator [Pyrinomonadaceae bacterium]|nr:transcriptional regulator [Pyrinomonadaceae bacterium]